MSLNEVAQGFCFICGETVAEDITTHFSDNHQTIVRKVKVQKLSWEHRLDKIVEAIEEIRQESDRGVQITKLDEDVIQQLYLVRARLAQLKGTPVKRVKEGSHPWE